MQTTINKHTIKKIDKYTVQLVFGDSLQFVFLSSYQKRLYVTKIPQKGQDCHVDYFLRQARILKMLQHKNIISLIQFKENVKIECQNGHIYESPLIVTQFAEEGDLFDLVLGRHLSQNICRTIFEQICSAMKYLHDEVELIHRDLKLQNIFADRDYQMKIADFGHAIHYNQLEKIEFFSYGTKQWTPPQCIKSKKISAEKADIFVCGLMLLRLAGRKNPIQNPNENKMIIRDPYYQKINKGEYQKFWRMYQKQSKVILSKELKDLIISMINPDPDLRPSFKQIQQSNWFKNTKPATHQQIKQRFSSLKNTRLNHPNPLERQRFQTLQRIKIMFNQVEEDNKKQTKIQENQNSGTRSTQPQTQYQQIKTQLIDLKYQKNAFMKIPEVKYWKVTYLHYEPEMLIIYLKKSLQGLLKDKVILNQNACGIRKPLQYLIQVQDIVEGIIKVELKYQIENFSDQNEFDKKQIIKQTEQVYDELLIKVYGQMVKYENNFGINWDLRDLNSGDQNTKQTIYELRNIMSYLGVDLLLDQK